MLEEDYPPDVASFLKQELELSKRKGYRCYYDEEKKKIVYDSSEDAMKVYIGFQMMEMERYRWIESERNHRDLGETAFIDWHRKFAPDFCKFWRKTHEFVPVQEKQRC